MVSSPNSMDTPTEVVRTPVLTGPGTPVEPDFGRYILIETIGSGGMGTVRRAYDPKLCREVALKVLRQDRRVEDGMQRLVREAQAMAQLSHSNVVSVFDVEESGGSVLIAMEFVRGTTLAGWLADERTPMEVLGAYLKAGRGLEAAHRVGLIHRDFKPANVLVGEEGEIKVTDFGLAKAVEGSVPAPNVLSSTSGENAAIASWDAEDLTQDDTMLGTPRYMAPEQILGDPASEASDQYAFCLALWESLLGERAYTHHPLKKMAKEKLAGAPAMPSSRPLPRVAMEAIQRGLDPSPSKRWESMTALLMALEGSTQSHSRRWLAIGTVFVGLGGAGLYVATTDDEDPCSAGPQQLEAAWSEERSRRLERVLVSTAPFVEDSWPRIEETLDDYANAWLAQYRDACEATHVRHEQSSFTLDMRMTCLERRRRGLSATVGVLMEADADAARRALDAVSALPSVETCADVERLAATAPPPDDPSDIPEIEALDGELTGIDSLLQLRQFERAREAIDALQDRVDALEYVPLAVAMKVRRGAVLARLGKPEEGVELMEEGLQLALEAGLWREAGRASRELARRLLDDGDRIREAEIYGNLAVSMANSDASIPEDRWLSTATLATVHQFQSRLEDALKGYARALDHAERTFGEDSLQTAASARALAQLQARLGHYDEAEPLLTRAVELAEQERGPNHPDVADMLSTFAILHGRQGHYEQAASVLERTIEIYSKASGPDSEYTARARINYGIALKGLKRMDEAREQLELANEVLEGIHGPDHRKVADVLQTLGKLEVAEEDYDTGLKHLERSTEIYVRILGEVHLDVALFRQDLGEVYRRLGRLDDAAAQLDTSIAIRNELGGPPHVHGDAALLLAKVLDEQRKTPARVRELLRLAIDRFGESKVDRTEQLEEARTMLQDRLADADSAVRFRP